MQSISLAQSIKKGVSTGEMRRFLSKDKNRYILDNSSNNQIRSARFSFLLSLLY